MGREESSSGLKSCFVEVGVGPGERSTMSSVPTDTEVYERPQHEKVGRYRVKVGHYGDS